MKTSARNQFHGTVQDVVLGTVNAEVQVLLKGGQVIIASITKESVATLKIEIGKAVIALIKTPQIILVSDFGGYTLSARNQLVGAISRIKPGAVNTEVDLVLTGGDSVAATITNDSVESLNLQVGDSVTAIFKAGSVILATIV